MLRVSNWFNKRTTGICSVEGETRVKREKNELSTTIIKYPMDVEGMYAYTVQDIYLCSIR